MSDKSGIEWTDATWNPTAGCSRVSDGCTHCYAILQTYRLGCNPLQAIGARYGGLTTRAAGRLDWNGQVRRAPEALRLPLRWPKPKRIFVNSMSDLFHVEVPFTFIDRVWSVMHQADWHTYQILTKRPGRMKTYLRGRTDSEASVLPNVWTGTSIEAQAQVWRSDELRETPAAVHFLSCEPLLGPLRLDLAGIDWVIIGGESGPRARPLELDWIRDLIAQCRAAGVAIFSKQLGAAWAQKRRRSFEPADLHGADWEHWPPDLCVREFPAVASAVPP